MIVEERTVIVDVVEPPFVRVTLAGENDAARLLGEEDPDSEIVPANPWMLVRVTVDVVELDVCIARPAGLEDIVKSAGTTLTVTVATCVIP